MSLPGCYSGPNWMIIKLQVVRLSAQQNLSFLERLIVTSNRFSKTIVKRLWSCENACSYPFCLSWSASHPRHFAASVAFLPSGLLPQGRVSWQPNRTAYYFTVKTPDWSNTTNLRKSKRSRNSKLDTARLSMLELREVSLHLHYALSVLPRGALLSTI